MNNDFNEDKFYIQNIFLNTGKNFKSMINRIEKNIIQFCETLGARSFTLGAINIENLSIVKQMYDQTVENLIEKKLQSIFSYEVNHNYILKRIAFDTYLFVAMIQPETNIQRLIEDIIRKLNDEKISYNDYLTHFSIKIGYTDFEKGQDLEEVWNQALSALFECKSELSINHSSYSNSLVNIQRHINNMELASHFQKAINLKKTRIGYQPIVDSKTKKVVSYECLLRIRTEEGEVISAGPFISIAEDFGFINQVDTLILKVISEKLEEDREIRLNINLSKAAVNNIQWIKLAKKLLYNKSISSRLTIEITETVLHQDLNKIAYFVQALRNLGCRIVIDDFGAGYTSFAQLKLIKIDGIKIDGIFIRDILTNKNSRFFISTLVSFARSLDLKTTAEYVENKEIANMLCKLGIEYLQGDYFGKVKINL